jgi:3-hydroxyisobutyrate dehydrogenase-like beta-hydroxyacid dehydrogenase
VLFEAENVSHSRWPEEYCGDASTVMRCVRYEQTEACTKPLIREGAIAAATPAEAELGADAVITMLFDDAAYEEVLFGVNSN